ncbi:MAG: sugar phosphate isomerase/epimerase [Oscillospiraceae bacterium]|nr:sugar phosphate isomerase/epimerase [Oscillospiraceae bacterium]
MRYGNCISYKDTNRIKILKKAGFDYVETQLAPLYTASQTEILDFLSATEKNNIKCEAVNVLFPGDIILTGETADVEFGKVRDYISKIFEKTKDFGYKIVVFGSGGARKCPDGFPKENAIRQIIQVIYNALIPAAEKYDFTLAIEELNRDETNIINTVAEAERIAKLANNPRVKILADFYHIALENDDIESLAQKGGILAHCHIANPYKRFYPHATDKLDAINLYQKFFDTLQNAGYIQNGRLSIEGNLGGRGDLNADNIRESLGDLSGYSAEDIIFYEESAKSLDFMRRLEAASYRASGK